MKSIFVSRLYEDRKWSIKIKKWQKEGQLEGFTITYETKDLRGNDNNIKAYLNRMINGAKNLLVLIGDDTHNHKWIKYEVEQAIRHKKNIFWMQIPKTKGGKLPILNKCTELKFHANQIVKYMQ